MNDTDTKKHSQIKFMNLILGVIIVIFIVGIGITLYNSTRKSGANVTENSNNIGNIQNEEKTLARFDNKIANIQNNGLDEISKKVLEDLFERRQNVIETIADFVDVRDVLKD